jgi:hypothetical protein
MARGIDITWAGGEHSFCLDIERLRALQQACDAGPAFVLKRLRDGSWMVDDILATIRLGLEGGGLSKDEARKLVRLHVEEDFGAKHIILAQVILAHTLYDGVEEDADEGEPKAAA